MANIELSDEKLVKKFLTGDEEIFSVLVNRHLKPIYNFLYRLTSNRSVLDDLAQETFIKAWKNIHRFNQSKSFQVWIFTIARNTAYDYLKKKKAIPFSNFLDEEGNNKLDKIGEDAPLPNEILERQDLAKELEKKLEEIPLQYRVILLLRYKNDFSLSEISEILDMPYNTVRSNYQRALEKIRKKLRRKTKLIRIN